VGGFGEVSWGGGITESAVEASELTSPTLLEGSGTERSLESSAMLLRNCLTCTLVL